MLRSSTSSNQVSSTSTFKGFTVLFTFVLFSFLTACSPKDTAIAPQADETTTLNTSVMSTNQTAIDSNATLKSVASFPIGVAFNSSIITNSPKAYRLFYSQFNSKTVHAYLTMEATQGKFNFKEPDYWVAQARTNQLRLHGHCLVHNGSAPTWLLNFSGNTTGFEAAIKNHIQTILGRYRGQIKSWDVVNEIFNDNGTIRTSPFRKLYDTDEDYMKFIKKCFVWAHEADPDAILFYNDYNYEISPAKLDAVVKMVGDFKNSGIPINGLGSQMHVSINTPESGIATSLRKLANTGLRVHISELDIKVNTQNQNDFTYSSQLQSAQALKFQNIARLYKSNVPAYLQFGITMWDFSDADSWLVSPNKPDMPTLFDKDYNKKADFYGFLNALKQ